MDGYIARRFKMNSVLGTILDPAADKTLMTTLTLTLAYKGMIPREYPRFMLTAPPHIRQSRSPSSYLGETSSLAYQPSTFAIPHYHHP